MARKTITFRRVMAAVERASRTTENPGFCIACGADADGVEPDARNYPCDVCGESKVFGAEEVLMMVSG